MTHSSGFGDSPSDRAERLDTMFHVLADEDRRHVIRYFTYGEECATSVEELIEFALDRSSGDPTREELERRYHHFTLPKLVEHGVVEFDDRSRMVRYRGPEAYGDALGAVEGADVFAE